MKIPQIISVVLLLALSFQCLSRLGLITAYHLYKDYIVATYCINKSKPELHCEGSCFMKKNLESSKEKARTTEHYKPVDLPSFLVAGTFQVPVAEYSGTRTMWFRQPIYSFIFREAPLQPPRIA